MPLLPAPFPGLPQKAKQQRGVQGSEASPVQQPGLCTQDQALTLVLPHEDGSRQLSPKMHH